MILPDKNVLLSKSLVGIGYLIIDELSEPQTVTSLWDKLRKYELNLTFQKFVLTLDFLFSLEIIDIYNGLIGRKA